jgi:hypothetical protein
MQLFVLDSFTLCNTSTKINQQNYMDHICIIRDKPIKINTKSHPKSHPKKHTHQIKKTSNPKQKPKSNTILNFLKEINKDFIN